MHVSSNKPVSEDEKKRMMYSPGSPYIVVAPVVTSWAVAGQRMVFFHMFLQARVTLEAFPIVAPKDAVRSSHEWEHPFTRLKEEPPFVLFQGDSGGPLDCKKNIVGVVSGSKECGDPKKPAVYTFLSERHIRWINNILKKQFNSTTV